MPLTVVPEPPADDSPNPASASLIDQIVREGARKMLAAALQAEVEAYIAAFAGERDEAGRRLVVRNGYHAPREILTAAGVVEVKALRVNDKRIDEDSGERRRFSSAILPAWARKTPQITEVLPLLYLHGLSSGDFVPALGQFLGSASGLSAWSSPGPPNSGRESSARSPPVTCPAWTTSTCGWTESTSTSGWRNTSCACW